MNSISGGEDENISVKEQPHYVFISRLQYVSIVAACLAALAIVPVEGSFLAILFFGIFSLFSITLALLSLANIILLGTLSLKEKQLDQKNKRSCIVSILFLVLSVIVFLYIIRI